MPDKVGFLISTTPGDWQRYIKWFTDEWVKKLGHPNNSIKKGPGGGAHGDNQQIIQAAQAFEADGDVKVVVTAGTGAALACKAHLTKPFVFAAVGDPALSVLRPGMDGNNFTGGNNRQADQAVVQKRVDWMLSHNFQGPFVVAGSNQNGSEPHNTAMDHAYNYLRSKGQAVQKQTITPQVKIPAFISGLKAQTPPVKSLYVCSDLYLTENSTLLNREAHKITPPGTPYINTMFEFEEHKSAHGADAWYGSNFQELFEKAAHYAHEIFEGTATPNGLLLFIASLSGGGQAQTKTKKTRRKSPTKKK